MAHIQSISEIKFVIKQFTFLELTETMLSVANVKEPVEALLILVSTSMNIRCSDETQLNPTELVTS